jgi:hypothetical protein
MQSLSGFVSSADPGEALSWHIALKCKDKIFIGLCWHDA